MSKTSKPSSSPVVKAEPKFETFYRIVQKSTYEHELQAVEVDVANDDLSKVGENDILSIVTHRLTNLMSGGKA